MNEKDETRTVRIEAGDRVEMNGNVYRATKDDFAGKTYLVREDAEPEFVDELRPELDSSVLEEMERDDAIRRIEDVELDLARIARGDLDINEPDVDLIRRRLTDARSDLVRSELTKEFVETVDEASPGDVVVFDEVRARVKRIEKDDD